MVPPPYQVEILPIQEADPQDVVRLGFVGNLGEAADGTPDGLQVAHYRLTSLFGIRCYSQHTSPTHSVHTLFTSSVCDFHCNVMNCEHYVPIIDSCEFISKQMYVA